MPDISNVIITAIFAGLIALDLIMNFFINRATNRSRDVTREAQREILRSLETYSSLSKEMKITLESFNHVTRKVTKDLEDIRKSNDPS